jgi:hypothetical protein
MDAQKLYGLIVAESPEAAMDEVAALLQEISADFPIPMVETAFWTAVRMYRGEFPGFRACNTEYHSLFHARQTFLTMARLLHGVSCEGGSFPPRTAALALIAAIFHDSGYLQEEGDQDGTGAKYARSHVERGIALLHRLREQLGCDASDLAAMTAMIQSTDLTVDYNDIAYPSADTRTLGQLLDVADLFALMSDPKYLEKLLFLFHEFREAGIRDYGSEGDLLRKTIGFYQMVESRLQPAEAQADRSLRAHFRRRHGLDTNPYRESIRRQRDYLQHILQITDQSPETHLHRGGIVEKVREFYRS